MRGFQQRLGPEPRTILAALPPGDTMAILWLAALTGGHQFVPISPEGTPAEWKRLETRYTPDVHVTEAAPPETSGGMTALALTRNELDVDLDHWSRAADADDPTAGWQPREGVLHLMTSGTTGAPKGVSLSARRIAWVADQIRQNHRLTSSDRGLSVLPFFHVNAPVVSLCASLQAGAAVVIAPRFSKSRFWSWIEREQITWASVVPTIVALLLQTERPEWLPGDLRFVRSASAPLPVAHLRAFEQRFDLPLVETYGLTEAASTVAANPVPPGVHKPGSVGPALGADIRVCVPVEPDQHTDLRDVEPGEEGEICLFGPGIIDGYEDGAGSESFQGGWFRTGDLGRCDDEGYLYITGRLRDIIVRGGNNISPREVEEVLMEHPAVREVAVVGRPDPIQGEVPVAYVVVSGSPPGLEDDLCAFAVQHLSRYKVPVAFQIVDALPHAPNGKLQRRRIGEMAAEAAQGHV